MFSEKNKPFKLNLGRSLKKHYDLDKGMIDWFLLPAEMARITLPVPQSRYNIGLYPTTLDQQQDSVCIYNNKQCLKVCMTLIQQPATTAQLA